MSLMPESTKITLSSPAAKLNAHDAGEASGPHARNAASAASDNLSSVPPFTGSMTIMGLPWRVATS